MKRLILLPVFLLFLAFPTLAQVKVGVKAGGARITHVRHYSDYPTQRRSGEELLFGVFSTIPLSEKVVFRPELLYSSRCLCEVFNFGPEGYNTFSLPVLVGYKPMPELTLLAGPELTYLPHYYDIGYFQNRFYAGIAGSVNYQFWKNFSVDATYSHGLTNLIDRGTWLTPTRFPDFYPVGANTSRSFRLGLAYTFGKNSDL